MGANSSLPLALAGSGKFMAAVKQGDAQAVAGFLQEHPELLRYKTLSHSHSPLHLAACHGHESVLRILLTSTMAQAYAEAAAAAASQERMSLFGRHKQHQQSAQAMLRLLANSKNDRNQTPLMLAAGAGHLGCVKLLLAAGADPWAVDTLGGRSALHYACKTDSAELIHVLVEAAGESGDVCFPNAPGTKYVDVRTLCGFSALHFCAILGHTEALQELITHHPYVNARSLYECSQWMRFSPGSTPLHVAASEGQTLACKILLKAHMEGWSRVRSADPRLIPDRMGRRPYHIAAQQQHTQLESILDPTTPLSRVFGADELALLGPPTLKLLASTALRRKLSAALKAIEQQGCRRCLRAGSCRRHSSRSGGHSADMHMLACEEIQQQAQKMACQQLCDKGSDEGGSACKQCQDGVPCNAALAAARAQTLAMSEAHSPLSAADTPSTSGSCTEGAGPLLRPEQGALADAAKLLVDAWGGDEECEEATCGVCLDARANVMLLPCTHVLCAGCCREMANMAYASITSCPFCRAAVGNYKAAPSGAC